MKNYFTVFSLTASFKLDSDNLEKKYLEFQQRFHPDNASSADIEQSILINEAYKILNNPLTRASHILQLNGIDLENDSNAPKPDMVTLEEILELQEQVAEIAVDEIDNLRKELLSKIKFLLEKTASELDQQEFVQAAQTLIRAKYFDKTLRDLKAKKFK